MWERIDKLIAILERIAVTLEKREREQTDKQVVPQVGDIFKDKDGFYNYKKRKGGAE